MPSLSFAAPILPGKTQDWFAFDQQLAEARHQEYLESRRRLGIVHEAAFYQPTPQGDMVIVYLEVQDPGRAFQGLATSQEPFDVWFRDMTLQLHGLDLTQPLPGPLPLPAFEWREGQ